MSLEHDITQIMEKDVFKPASKAELTVRKQAAGPLWFSLRAVRANSEEDAVNKVIEEDFEEEHPLCDVVIPASQIKIKDQPIMEADVFKPASKAELKQRGTIIPGKLKPGQRQRVVFDFNIWDYIDIEGINEILDGIVADENIMASDIGYNCLNVSTGGHLEVEADFDAERV
jgi:hypothetical protein